MVDVAFKNDKIIPDVVDEAPNKLVSVNWVEANVSADLGNEITPRQMKEIPVVEWEADSDSFYTLLMVDPDAPETFRQVRHWAVVNIPGNQLANGEVKTEYVGSGAPQGTGLHRYIFLIFKQQAKHSFDGVEFSSKNSRKGRLSFNTRTFVAQHNLSLVAANFIKAQYDDYVPEVHKQFTEI